VVCEQAQSFDLPFNLITWLGKGMASPQVGLPIHSNQAVKAQPHATEKPAGLAGEGRVPEHLYAGCQKNSGYSFTSIGSQRFPIQMDLKGLAS
jgi:hypothetical protein